MFLVVNSLIRLIPEVLKTSLRKSIGGVANRL